MLMFWDALREAARRRQDKKSNIPSPNDCFSAKNTKTEFYSEDKNEYLQKKKKTYQKSLNGGVWSRIIRQFLEHI